MHATLVVFALITWILPVFTKESIPYLQIQNVDNPNAVIDSTVRTKPGQKLVLKCLLNCTECEDAELPHWHNTKSSYLHLNVNKNNEGKYICWHTGRNLTKSIFVKMINRKMKRDGMFSITNMYDSKELDKMREDIMKSLNRQIHPFSEERVDSSSWPIQISNISKMYNDMLDQMYPNNRPFSPGRSNSDDTKPAWSNLDDLNKWQKKIEQSDDYLQPFPLDRSNIEVPKLKPMSYFERDDKIYDKDKDQNNKFVEDNRPYSFDPININDWNGNTYKKYNDYEHLYTENDVISEKSNNKSVNMKVIIIVIIVIVVVGLISSIICCVSQQINKSNTRAATRAERTALQPSNAEDTVYHPIETYITPYPPTIISIEESNEYNESAPPPSYDEAMNSTAPSAPCDNVTSNHDSTACDNSSYSPSAPDS